MFTVVGTTLGIGTTILWIMHLPSTGPSAVTVTLFRRRSGRRRGRHSPPLSARPSILPCSASNSGILEVDNRCRDRRGPSLLSARAAEAGRWQAHLRRERHRAMKRSLPGQQAPRWAGNPSVLLRRGSPLGLKYSEDIALITQVTATSAS